MNDKSVNNKTNVSDGSLYLDQEAEDTITIYLDDCEVECGIIASFPLDGPGAVTTTRGLDVSI